MSAPENSSYSDPRAQAAPGKGPVSAAPHKRPWGWIAVAGLLAAGIVALGIYAINLNSDLDDANAKIASQQQEIDQAQDSSSGVAAAAKAAYDQLSAQLGATQQDASEAVEQAAAELDQAQQAATEAKGTVEELQKQADAAQAKAATAATCAQSFLSAFGMVFEGTTLKQGVEATVQELQGLEPQCAPALSQDGSTS